MNELDLLQILHDTDYIRVSATEEELKAAEYLQAYSKKLGAKAWLESFTVPTAKILSASLTADGKEIPCKGFKLSGCGDVEAPLCYLPNTDPASITKAKGCIVLLDTGMSPFVYQDLVKAGMQGFITYDGNVMYADRDIDQKELRPYVSQGNKVVGVNINAKDAAALVASAPKTVHIHVEQEESESDSHNVVAEIPGRTDEWIVFTAHYDTTPLSHGCYDNMTGCVGLLGIMEKLMQSAPNRYSLRFIFCGSEERGLLGSKAYVAKHEDELEKIALNINLDMLGTIMGKFIACVSAEEKLVHYLQYFCAERGFGMDAHTGVYASDSTPFADKGVPALSFARLANPAQAQIHTRYDNMDILSGKQLKLDIEFLCDFSDHMANAVKCPVSRKIPDRVKTELDEYMFRKRKD